MLPKITTGLNTSDTLDYLADFISRGDYGDGMSNIAIAYLYREKAIKGNCAFFDPAYVNGNISILNQQLADQDSPILVTSSIDVYSDESLAPAENRQAYCDLFKNTLQAINYASKTFDKIFIPIGCYESGKAGHNIAVVLEKARRGYKATIVDQMGGASYSDTKAQIIQDLGDMGIVDIDYNRNPMSLNRNDCATFVSLCCSAACEGIDFRQLINNSDTRYERYGQTWIGQDTVDIQHSQDKNLLRDAATRLAEDLFDECPALQETNNTPKDLVARRMLNRALDRQQINYRLLKNKER